MTRAILPLALLTSFAALSPALTESVEQARKELHAVVKTEEENQKSTGKRPRMGSSSYLSDLDRKLDTAERQEIDVGLDRIVTNYPSPAVSQAVEKLRITLKLEAKKLEDDELASIDALRKELGEAIPKANTPEDLDDLLEKLVTLINGTSDHRTAKVTNAISDLTPLKTFTSSWQDYLQARNAGEADKADQILSYLSSTNGQIPIPRSTVLARIGQNPPAPPAPAAAAAPAKESPRGLRDITELDQMTALLQELREMSQNVRERPPGFDQRTTESCINALAPLEKIYQNFKTGLPTDLAFLSERNDSSAAVTALSSIPQLKAKLLLLVLPAQLGIPQDDAPRPGETVIAFLNRTEKAAAERGDAATCTGVIDARLALDSTGSLVEMEKISLRSFRAGQAQETAGQLLSAVRSYQSALQSGPGPSLATLVGKRLEEIKRTHPEETRKLFEGYQ